MAIGATRGGGVRTGGIPQVLVGSALNTIVQANDDARTAQTATMRYGPAGITDSTFHWVRVPAGTTRVLIRARTPIATTAVGTSPVVWLLGAMARDTEALADCAGVNDGTVQYLRLDSATYGGTGQTLTFDATPATTDSLNDSVWFYSDVASLTATDLQGCQWVGVAVATAGANTASAAMPIDLIFEN